MIPPRSSFIGQPVFPGMVTPSGDLVILAVKRPGEDLGPTETELAAGDILLTDLGLPGMSGVELAMAARERLPGLPVIFASGRAVEPIASLPAQALLKPFALDALGSALESARRG